jgi:hypothetical protein
MKPLEDRILAIAKFKAKDIFNIVSVTQNDSIKSYMSEIIS